MKLARMVAGLVIGGLGLVSLGVVVLTLSLALK